jgi:pyruvate formate lyase activating enzyme
MSTVQTLKPGSRHDLRVGISPDAPDEARSRTRKGAFGYCHSYETVVPIRRAGPARRAVRLRLPAALHVLPQSGYLASEGRHLRFGRSGARRLSGDFAPALRSLGGGLTISGGEAMVQLAFTRRIFAGAKEWACTRRSRPRVSRRSRRRKLSCPNIDLVLLDIKSSDPDTYRRVTGRDLAPTLRFAERLARWASRSGSASRSCPARPTIPPMSRASPDSSRR